MTFVIGFVRHVVRFRTECRIPIIASYSALGSFGMWSVFEPNAESIIPNIEFGIGFVRHWVRSAFGSFTRTTATRLNSCLVNRYENGRDYVPFHADDEKMFRPKGDIVSASFGAPRRFLIESKMQRRGQPMEMMDVVLDPGTVLLMGGN